jgi:hypothetical protein
MDLVKIVLFEKKIFNSWKFVEHSVIASESDGLSPSFQEKSRINNLCALTNKAQTPKLRNFWKNL